MIKTEDTATEAVAPAGLSEHAAQDAEQGYVLVQTCALAKQLASARVIRSRSRR